MRILTAIAIGSFSVVIQGCASSQAVRPPDAPQELRPPEDQALALEVPATGVQIYECSAAKDQPARFEWAFKAPEAELFDKTGRKIGKHYAGPTWESNDGSAVVGEVKARDSGPDSNAIPWLLLARNRIQAPASSVRSRASSAFRLSEARRPPRRAARTTRNKSSVCLTRPPTTSTPPGNRAADSYLGARARRCVAKISFSRSTGIPSTVWPLPVTVVALRSEL